MGKTIELSLSVKHAPVAVVLILMVTKTVFFGANDESASASIHRVPSNSLSCGSKGNIRPLLSSGTNSLLLLVRFPSSTRSSNSSNFLRKVVPKAKKPPFVLICCPWQKASPPSSSSADQSNHPLRPFTDPKAKFSKCPV